MRPKKLFLFLIAFFAVIVSDYGLTQNNYPPFIYDVYVLTDNNNKALPDKDIKEAIENAQEVISKIFGATLSTPNIYQYPYKQYFDMRLGEKIDSNIEKYRINIFNINPPVLKKMISSYKSPAFIYAFKGEVPKSDKVRYNSLIGTYRNTFAALQEIKDISGKHVITEENHYYSLAYINAMLYMDTNWDKSFNWTPKIYITNHIIIDDEIDMPVHTLIRGGLANGLSSLQSRSMIVSYYGLLNDEYIQKDNNDLVRFNRNKILGALIVHEFGHAAMKMPDEFLDNGSVMYPVWRFNYWEWFDNLTRHVTQGGAP